jgi:hypothetical protein
MGDAERPDAAHQPEKEHAREPWREVELRRLVADIAARLRKSCAHLSDEEFSKLVLDIAHRRMRFDDMDPVTGRVRTTD